MRRRKGKLIHLSSHHFANREDKTIWADVWIRFTHKPGRRRIYLAPTLIGKADVRRDLELERKHPGYHLGLENAEAILASKTLIVDPNPRPDMATLYAPAEMISPQIAEETIATWLKTRFGFQNLRFKWARSRYQTRPS